MANKTAKTNLSFDLAAEQFIEQQNEALAGKENVIHALVAASIAEGFNSKEKATAKVKALFAAHKKWQDMPSMMQRRNELTVFAATAHRFEEATTFATKNHNGKGTQACRNAVLRQLRDNPKLSCAAAWKAAQAKAPRNVKWAVRQAKALKEAGFLSAEGQLAQEVLDAMAAPKAAPKPKAEPKAKAKAAAIAAEAPTPDLGALLGSLDPNSRAQLVMGLLGMK